MADQRVVGKLGRLPAKHRVGARFLGQLLEAPLPAPPAAFDFGPSLQWGMLGNDRYGDCGVAGLVHLRMAAASVAGESKAWPDTDEVVAAYLAYTKGQDSGVVLTDFLDDVYQNGFLGEKIGPHVPVDIRDLAEVWSATYLCGGLYIGIACSESTQELFAAGQPLDLTGSAADRNILGGHCVVVEGRSVVSNGPGGKIVTWGAGAEFTERWWMEYVEEGHAVFTTEAMAAPNGVFNGVRIAQAEADLAELPAAA